MRRRCPCRRHLVGHESLLRRESLIDHGRQDLPGLCKVASVMACSEATAGKSKAPARHAFLIHSFFRAIRHAAMST